MVFLHHFIIYFSIAFLLFASNTNAESECFFPSGNISGDVPCDPEAPVSMCCGSPENCLSNGLCIQPIGATSANISYARGTCTDNQWGSDICPQHCLSNQDSIWKPSAANFRTGGVQVWECGNTTGHSSPASYCCESNAEKTRCCSTPSAVFELGAATIGNPSATTSTFMSFSTTSITSQARSSSTSRLSLSSDSTLSVTSLATSVIGPNLHSTSSLTSPLATSVSSLHNSKMALRSLVGGILGGIAFLCMAMGGLWFWSNNPRTKRQTGGPEWFKPELPADVRISSPLSLERIHEIHGGIKDYPELPASTRYELVADDGAHEVPTSI